MTGLWQDIQETMAMLDTALAECKRRGAEMVAAEAEYYTAKARAAFDLKENGNAVGFIAMVIKGMPEVGEAMTRYHAAQVSYENAKEARLVLKKRLDVLREQMQREWQG